MALRTRLTDKLGIRHPVLLAPIAVCLPRGFDYPGVIADRVIREAEAALARCFI